MNRRKFVWWIIQQSLPFTGRNRTFPHLVIIIPSGSFCIETTNYFSSSLNIYGRKSNKIDQNHYAGMSCRCFHLNNFKNELEFVKISLVNKIWRCHVYKSASQYLKLPDSNKVYLTTVCKRDEFPKSNHSLCFARKLIKIRFSAFV